MFLTFKCPRCEHPNQSEELVAHPQLVCSNCGWKKELDELQSAPEKAPPICLCCGNTDLWRQKNFPQWLGFVFVATGAVTSSIAWGYHRPVLALGILMGFALLDMILYLVMSDVLVCYRCQAKLHEADVSQYGAFNHELAERYRQERIQLERSRNQQSSDHTPSAKVS